MDDKMKITLTEWPNEHDWMEVKRRALVTVGLKPKSAPDAEWMRKMLNARHSPIRRLRFSFDLEGVPSYVSVHLVRHIHAQPYVKSQRNDRQQEYDRTKAPQDAPVNMIWDITGEELLIIANKRLCNQADPTTQAVVLEMCRQAAERCPELKPFLVPMCKYHGGVCHEMFPCKRKCVEV